MRGQCSASLTNIFGLRRSQLTTPLFLNKHISNGGISDDLDMLSCHCSHNSPFRKKRWKHVTNWHKRHLCKNKRHPESKISPFRTPQHTGPQSHLRINSLPFICYFGFSLEVVQWGSKLLMQALDILTFFVLLLQRRNLRSLLGALL